MKAIFMMILLLISKISIKSNNELIYNGDTNKNHIYLTFDDGHSYINTTKILDILKEKNVPATFFIEGDFLTQNQILIKRIVNEQTLGNHTMCHKNIRLLSNADFRNDIERYESIVYKMTGRLMTKYFRPPMGKINQEKINILKEYKYNIFLWNVSYYDYSYNNDKGVDYAYDNIMKQTKNGSIILMHTLTKSNVKVLPIIIDELRNKGFIFSKLEELVASNT